MEYARAAAQDSDPPPGAVLPDGHSHAGQSGGRGVTPVRRTADLYRGDDDGMVTPAGMVNGLYIRVDPRIFTENAPVGRKRFLPSLPLDFYRRYPLLAKVGKSSH